jgi:hypothetical protein
MNTCCGCFVNEDKRRRKNDESTFIGNTPTKRPIRQHIEGYTGEGGVFEKRPSNRRSTSAMGTGIEGPKGHELKMKKKGGKAQHDNYGSEYSLTPS